MKNLFSLNGVLAIVVGPQGNLGPIWIETLEEAGATVCTLGLPSLDLSDVEKVRGLKTSQLGTSPDIIVCNAAVDTPPSNQDARFFDDFERTMQVNLNAHVRIVEAFLPGMINNGYGVIVLVGSIQGRVGANWTNYEGDFEKPVAYNCSKAALPQFARSLTVQYGRYGIRGVCISFGPYISGKLPQAFLDKITSKIPIQRTVAKQSIQRTLLYACCCEDLAGQEILVDGGYTVW